MKVLLVTIFPEYYMDATLAMNVCSMDRTVVDSILFEAQNLGLEGWTDIGEEEGQPEDEEDSQEEIDDEPSNLEYRSNFVDQTFTLVQSFSPNKDLTMEEWNSILSYVSHFKVCLNFKSSLSISPKHQDKTAILVAARSSDAYEFLTASHKNSDDDDDEDGDTHKTVELSDRQILSLYFDEPTTFFPDYCIYALFDALTNHAFFEHTTCNPSGTVQFGVDGKITIIPIKTNPSSEQSGVAPSVSLIDTSEDFETRSSELAERGILCNCDRCKVERVEDCDPAVASIETSAVSIEKVKELLELAKTQQRFTDALKLIDLVKLREGGPSAELTFDEARIRGWKSEFVFRERVLRDGSDERPEDENLKEALRECDAYYRAGDDSPVESTSEVNAVEGMSNKAFVIESLLSGPECASQVTTVESHIMSSSDNVSTWKTRRHYSVPTTDIPVFEIPELLGWFNTQLEHKIFPIMHKQFDVDAGERRFRIFDAFIVKYSALVNGEGQRHLPLHNDQAEYSLTIALNDELEYEGGGTYFQDIGRPVKTATGGMVSFGKGVMHAGEEITGGLRYIIVCFIYAEDKE